MHFSIPDTRDIKEETGSPYVAYNIHVNGTFHCTVRYRQLHNLHDQLKREFGQHALPSFPPKKILPLTPLQTEERRAQLEKYIQLVSQDPRIVNSDVFNGFLLSAQQESLNVTETDVEVQVYLMNWQKLTVSVKSNAPSSHVLEAVSTSLSLSPDLTCYFCLYLVHKDNNKVTIQRRMEDFEAPYMTLKTAGANHFLVIRKSYWDSSYDDEVIDDRTALNLLYVQALSDVELGWVSATKEIQRQLTALQSRGSKNEYIQLARTLKYYGYLQFKPCTCDYPQPGSKVLISVGGKELNFRVQMPTGDQIKEMSFRVTRIRCWRITTSHQDTCANGNCTGEGNVRLELSFEYLVSKDKLQWIAITSNQAILMSVCLQAMVEELLMKRSGTQFRKSQEQQRWGVSNGNAGISSNRRGSWSYMKRDGSSHQISISRSVSTDGIVNNATTPQMEHPKNSITGKSTDVKKVAEKLASVSIKPSNKGGSVSSARALVENDAFEGIGDDDL